jgi:hypothetical protein
MSDWQCWWTDSWLSIASVGCGLIGVGASEEQARKIYTGGQTSRLGSRDPVADGIKCGSHDDKNNKMKSWTVPWLSIKAKIEPGRCEGQVMSGDWRETTPNLRGFQWFTTKSTSRP